MTLEAIRIRIVVRNEYRTPISDPRDAFWAVMKATTDSNQSIAELEARLCRDLGPSLRQALISHLAEPVQKLDSIAFPGSMRDFEKWFFRYIDGPGSSRDSYGYQFADAFARIMEQRQQVFRESPSLRRIQERLSLVSGLYFSTKIAGYSSLNLDLLPGSFKQIAAIFDNDFDSFRVFLDAFVPVAFANVFTEQTADRYEFSISIPTSSEIAFRNSHALPEPAPHPSLPSSNASTPHMSSSREKAEWLWRLANGSLLVPFILALLVMWQGMKMLTEIRTTQYEAIKPMMEHQLKLLEEDRLRFFRESKTEQQSHTQPDQK